MSLQSDFERLQRKKKENEQGCFWLSLLGIYCIWAGELYNETVFWIFIIIFLFLRSRR
tara:strand:+ start:1141 stop:1314 length:174 start_codon:yes stop_codon:yes gene_type:complete